MLYSHTSDQHFHLLLRQERSRLYEKQERERERERGREDYSKRQYVMSYRIASSREKCLHKEMRHTARWDHHF